MKSTLSIAVMALLVSCAGAKKNVYTPGGEWNYMAYDTPVGNTGGIFTLVETEEGLRGAISSVEFGTSQMENLTYGEGHTLTCTFYMADLTMYMTGTFAGEEFVGSIDAGSSGTFRVTASRKSEDSVEE